MLADKHRRWRHDRHLLAGKDCRRSSAQCHLGFAEPDIAADKPVHRPARREVLQSGFDRPSLVLGFSEREPGGKACIFAPRWPQHLRASHLSVPRQFDERARGLRDLLLDFGTPLRPSVAAQPVERAPDASAPYRQIRPISSTGASKLVSPA